MDLKIYKDLYRLEKNHWWFAGKRNIVLSILREYLPKKKSPEILDAGCGTGLMLKHLQKYGTAYGMDFSDEAIRYAKKNFKGKIKKGTLPNLLPYPKSSFDTIIALDVLEHIEDDERSLQSLKSLLKKNGILLITVPAYMLLWSAHDNAHHHKRRYTLKELTAKIDSAGMKIKKISYYNTLLFAPILGIRLLNKILKKDTPESDAKMPSPFLNSILTKIFSFEKHLLKITNLPFGVSIIAVIQNR